MISLFLLILAAVCNAFMDNTAHHWYKSVFRKLNPDFWNPNVSCNTAYIVPLTGWKFDLWHICKSLMIILICASIVLYVPIFAIGDVFAETVIDFVILGCFWNLTFNLFYNHILCSE